MGDRGVRASRFRWPGRCLKVPMDRITDADFAAGDWFISEDATDPKGIELP